MKTNEDALRQTLASEAAGQLPPFDDRLHERVIAAIARSQRTASAPRHSNHHGLAWAIGLSTATCVLIGVWLARPAPIAAPGDDLSTSFAALTTAAGPARQVAMVPIDRVHQNLSALHDDTQRLARFVSDQLDVLPSPG